MSLTALDWVQVLLLGAILGAAGQVIRSIAGLKKLSDDSAQKGLTFREAFSPSRMVISIVIGAVAGIVGVISLNIDAITPMSTDKVVAILAVGYAGADFIEAFMSKAMPRSEPPSPTQAPGAVASGQVALQPGDANAVG